MQCLPLLREAASGFRSEFFQAARLAQVERGEPLVTDRDGRKALCWPQAAADRVPGWRREGILVTDREGGALSILGALQFP